MSATADRRKIRQLEESLDEADKAKKKLERENTRLQRDLKEVQEKLDQLETSGIIISDISF